MTELRTSRLLLREWRETDLEPFAALNADARVMEFFPSLLTREESDRFVRELGVWPPKATAPSVSAKRYAEEPPQRAAPQ
jgi:RimJ/RimL family protein N-acetyltransferase